VNPKPVSIDTKKNEEHTPGKKQTAIHFDAGLAGNTRRYKSFWNSLKESIEPLLLSTQGGEFESSGDKEH